MRKTLFTSASVALFAAGMVGAAASPAAADQESDGSNGVASGNQIDVPVDVQAEICGNNLNALGISESECEKVSQTLYAASEEGADQDSDGSGGVASGNQIDIPVDVALDVCGNGITVGGISEAKCEEFVEHIATSKENGQDSDGSGGVASGNQIDIPVDVALDVCGNNLNALGISKSECEELTKAVEESAENEGGQDSDGSGGVASGNQVSVPVNVAVDICGNAASVLGVAEAECETMISEDGGDGGDGDDGDNGDGGDGDNGDGDNGDGGDGNDGKDGGDEDKGKDEEGAKDGDDESSEDAAPEADEANAGGNLPVTGVALGGLVAAAVAAVGGGGAAMYISRKRKAAATADEGAESTES